MLLAEQRKRVFADLSETLKGTIAWQINGDWLERIPVLQRLPRKFLVQVALNMSSAVYAPKEKPPAQRIYVIIKGVCTYGGPTLKQGGHWGQNDLANTKQPLCATAITYLHVNYVATQTILELADNYGDATILREMKKWMLFQVSNPDPNPNTSPSPSPSPKTFPETERVPSRAAQTRAQAEVVGREPQGKAVPSRAAEGSVYLRRYG